MALSISVLSSNEIPVITLEGRIIDVDVKKFHKKLEALTTKYTDSIILDISNVEFIDSHGLGIMIYFHQTLQKSKRKLAILNKNNDPTSYVSRLFEVTNLNQILNIISDPSQL